MIKSIDLEQSYGEFLNRFPWDWYCTLTFRQKVSPRKAFKLFNRWKVELKKASKQRIDYVMVIEPTEGRGGLPHLHLLMAGVKDVKPYVWERRWYLIGGLAKIEVYDPTLGANYYLGNKMVNGIADIVFSQRVGDIVKAMV